MFEKKNQKTLLWLCHKTLLSSSYGTASSLHHKYPEREPDNNGDTHDDDEGAQSVAGGGCVLWHVGHRSAVGRVCWVRVHWAHVFRGQLLCGGFCVMTMCMLAHACAAWRVVYNMHLQCVTSASMCGAMRCAGRVWYVLHVGCDACAASRVVCAARAVVCGGSRVAEVECFMGVVTVSCMWG